MAKINITNHYLSPFKRFLAAKAHKKLKKEAFSLLFIAMKRYILENINENGRKATHVSAKYYPPVCTTAISLSQAELAIIYAYTSAIAQTAFKKKRFVDPLQAIKPLIFTVNTGTITQLASLMIVNSIYNAGLAPEYQLENALFFLSAFQNNSPDYYFPRYFPDYLLGIKSIKILSKNRGINILIKKIEKEKNSYLKLLLHQLKNEKISLKKAYQKFPIDENLDNLFCKKNTAYIRSNVIGKYRDNSDYESIKYPAIFQLQKLLSPHLKSSDIFVDFGCGTARLINIFSSILEIQRFVGIEIDTKIFNAAKYNIENNNFNKSDLELLQMDAVNFDCEKGTVFYFFHPFGEKTMSAVAKNIWKSLKTNPRRILIIYYNPFYANAFSVFGKPFLKSTLDAPLYLWKFEQKKGHR